MTRNSVGDVDPGRSGVVSNSTGDLLLITHSLQRNGAPLTLLEYGQWLVQRGERVQSLALEGGDLEAEFSALGKLHHLPVQTRRLEHPRGRRALRMIARTVLMQWIRATFAEVGVIHANTTSSSWVTPYFAQANKPVVSHIHELPFWMEQRTGREKVEAMLRASNELVCVGDGARRYFVDEWGVDATHIHVVPPLRARRPVPGEKGREMRRSLGIDPDAFVVGGCGTTDWRKGPDLFIRVALELQRLADHASWVFLWLGAGTPIELAELRHDLQRYGLRDRVRFLDPVADPVGSGWYATLDAFALTSREDPFPLVMQEAAGARVPIVGFAQSGGVEDFVIAGETGEIVSYGDCRAMGQTLDTWIRDPARAQRYGAAGYDRLVRDYDPEQIGQQLLRVDRAASSDVNLYDAKEATVRPHPPLPGN